MGILVNPDNLAFQVALNSEIYVDKSGLIKYTNKVLNTLQAYICNSRPRRFGKEDSGCFQYIRKFPEYYSADDTSGLQILQTGDA